MDLLVNNEVQPFFGIELKIWLNEIYFTLIPIKENEHGERVQSMRDSGYEKINSRDINETLDTKNRDEE